MAVKAQVEEKERLKRLERERKMKEDMEEERKLQAERELLQKQFESEQQKMRQKEVNIFSQNFILLHDWRCLQMTRLSLIKINSFLTLYHTVPTFNHPKCLQYKSFENTVEKKKLPVTSNFFFSHSVFHSFLEIFIKFKIVVCKLFHFGPVQKLFGKGLINIVEKGKKCW